MKMGKTKELTKYMESHCGADDRVLIVSFRQTFTANIMQGRPDFTSYADIQGNLANHKKLVVQVESLHRYFIEPGMEPPDLLVLDESELILEQFGSGLHQHLREGWEVFQWIMRMSKHAIFMDANMSDRTFNTVMKMRVEKMRGTQLFYHDNVYMNATDDVYMITPNKSRWYSKFYNDLDAGLKLAVASNSLAEAEVLERQVIKKYPNLKVKLYSSKTSISEKKLHMGDIHQFWSYYDVIIYTPTVSAGVSYELKHFDKVYAYMTDKSCTVEVCDQMLGRVRDVRLHEYNICLDVHSGNLPTDVESIRRMLYTPRMHLYVDFKENLMDYEIRDNGFRGYIENPYFWLFLENKRIENISKSQFASRIISIIATKGAHLEVMTPNEEEERMFEIECENKETRKEIVLETVKEIADAKDLKDNEIASIQDKFRQQVDVSQEEKAGYERYKLRRDFNFGGEMNDSFVKKYNNGKMRKIYKNLRRIMAKDTVDESLKTVEEQEREHNSLIVESSEYFHNADLSRNYVFDQHRVAIAILRACGWVKGPADHSYLPQVTVLNNIKRDKNNLFNMIEKTYHLFGASPPRVYDFEYKDGMDPKEYLEKVLRVLNKVLRTMYGVSVSPQDIDGTPLYVLSKLQAFDINKIPINEDIPNVHAVWQL